MTRGFREPRLSFLCAQELSTGGSVTGGRTADGENPLRQRKGPPESVLVVSASPRARWKGLLSARWEVCRGGRGEGSAKAPPTHQPLERKPRDFRVMCQRPRAKCPEPPSRTGSLPRGTHCWQRTGTVNRNNCKGSEAALRSELWCRCYRGSGEGRASFSCSGTL